MNLPKLLMIQEDFPLTLNLPTLSHSYSFLYARAALKIDTVLEL